jgi:glutaredoxin
LYTVCFPLAPVASGDRQPSIAEAGPAGAVALVWRPGCASCAAAKEFLTVNGIAFESVNPVEDEGAARWAALGSPRIPSLVLGGRTTAIYHTSQVAALLGLTPAGRGEAVRLAWDLAAIAEAWSEQIAQLSFELLTAPTPSRGRTVRNLTVNVHEPLALMAEAWESGLFVWDTDLDEGLAAALGDAGAVRAYAEVRTAGWIGFLMDLGDELGRADPELRAGSEPIAFSTLLDAQRFHAAFHYRQIRTFLEAATAAPGGALDLARLEGLRLPQAVF